ncbi:MAG: hypothetical protein CVV19_07515 [Gammaproteobacteria bacterium HGW-Gammaproteobacteria-9]|nr:MAG: hypothetical protein CVV19_07515 [Gammaproteobacteria bacterium HGW-Gammaproteobacteria-9]
MFPLVVGGRPQGIPAVTSWASLGAMSRLRWVIATRSVRFIEFQEQCLCQPPAELGREFTQQQMKV